MSILASSTGMQTNCQGQMNTTQNLEITWSGLARNVAVVDATLYRRLHCELSLK